MQVDGFPPPEEILTVYVAHDIQAEVDDPQVIDYLAVDEQILKKGLDKAACEAALRGIGFDDTRIYLPLTALSGARSYCIAPSLNCLIPV